MDAIYSFFGTSAVSALTGLNLIGVITLFLAGWFLGGFFYNFLKVTALLRGGAPSFDIKDWIRLILGILFLILAFVFGGGLGIFVDFFLVFLIAFVVSVLFKTFKVYAVGLMGLLIFAVIFLFLSLFWTLTQFTGKTAVLEVKVENVERLNNGEKLITLEVEDLQNGGTKTYTVEGDMWGVSGNVLLFDDWVVFFGGKTYYKMNSIVGMSETRIDREPLDEVSFETWKKIEENEDRLDWFLRAVYQDTVTKSPFEGESYTIYVDNDGSLVPELNN